MRSQSSAIAASEAGSDPDQHQKKYLQNNFQTRNYSANNNGSMAASGDYGVHNYTENMRNRIISDTPPGLYRSEGGSIGGANIDDDDRSRVELIERNVVPRPPPGKRFCLKMVDTLIRIRVFFLQKKTRKTN